MKEPLTGELRKKSKRDGEGFCDRKFESILEIVDYFDGWTDGDGEELVCVMLDGESYVNIYELEPGREIDWKKVALGLMQELVPALQIACRPGAPRISRPDLVNDVHAVIDEFKTSGRRCSIRSACDSLARRVGSAVDVYGVEDLRSAYYREMKKRKK